MSPKSGAPVRRVLAYCRVSSVGQEEHGVSLDVQRAELEKYCTGAGLPAPWFYVEVESAGEERIDHRTELARLMREVGPGVLVLVTRQDRWSRDTLQFLQSCRAIVAAG